MKTLNAFPHPDADNNNGFLQHMNIFSTHHPFLFSQTHLKISCHLMVMNKQYCCSLSCIAQLHVVIKARFYRQLTSQKDSLCDVQKQLLQAPKYLWKCKEKHREFGPECTERHREYRKYQHKVINVKLEMCKRIQLRSHQEKINVALHGDISDSSFLTTNLNSLKHKFRTGEAPIQLH